MNCRQHLYIYIFGNRERRVTVYIVYRVVHRVFSFFRFFRLTKTVKYSEPPSIQYMLLCRRRSFFPIRVYNHRRDCTGENPSGHATYVIDIPDDGALCPPGLGLVSLRRCRTNGWKVRVYFAKRARLTNRTNPPSHKPTRGSTVPVHSNRHLCSHPSQVNARVSLYIHYYYIFL